jgi:hypothetical protein
LLRVMLWTVILSTLCLTAKCQESVHLHYSPLYTYCYREWTERPHCFKGRESLPFAWAGVESILRGTNFDPNVDAWVKIAPPPLFALQPNRTNRQTLTAHYLIPVAMMLGAGAAMKLRCKTKTVTCGGWADAMVPPAAVGALAYPVDRWIGTPMAWGAMGYAIGRDTYGAVTGNYQ